MFKRILKYLIVAVIVCYALFALCVIPSFKESGVCRDVIINVNDNEMEIISRDEVMELLKKEGLDPSGKKIDGFNCYDIENFIDSISNCFISFTLDCLRIALSPIFSFSFSSIITS